MGHALYKVPLSKFQADDMRNGSVYNVWKMDYLTSSDTLIYGIPLYGAVPRHGKDTYTVTSFRIVI